VKWLYHCSYCGERTLEEVKRDSISCGYCEHPAPRMQSTSERLGREKALLDLEAKTLAAGYTVNPPWWKRLFRK